MPNNSPSFEQLALADAEGHVTEGEQTLAHQRQIVARVEQDGHDASTARELLAIFEETLAMHKADRERLRQEAGLTQPTHD